MMNNIKQVEVRVIQIFRFYYIDTQLQLDLIKDLNKKNSA